MGRYRPILTNEARDLQERRTLQDRDWSGWFVSIIDENGNQLEAVPILEPDGKLGRAVDAKVMDEATRLNAIPYDVKNVELGHHGKECSFEAILKKYNLTSDPALVLLGKIVNGADTDNTLYHQPEGPGLEAIADGFRHLGFKDDHALNAAEWIVYDALYAYCQKMVRDGKPDGDFVIKPVHAQAPHERPAG